MPLLTAVAISTPTFAIILIQFSTIRDIIYSKGSRDERDRSLIAERYKAAHERKMEKLSKNLSGVVSPALRWTIFAMNVVFWLVGLLTILIGIWAFVQKTQKQKSRTIQGVLDVVTDIAIVFSILGFVVFSLSFAGCVGTLRQNIGLLRFFRYVLIIILGLQIIAIVCLIIFASVSVKYIQEFVKKTAIVQYTEDIDLQNIIDFIQLSLKCCGAGEDSYNDWNGNRYFNCTEDNPSTERCSLPFSCCMAPNDIDADIINTKCAYKVLKETTAQIQTVVWPFGCVSKIKSLVKRVSNIF